MLNQYVWVVQFSWVPVSVEVKLSFVEPGRRWAHSPTPSKVTGISYQGTMKTSVRMLKPQVVSNCFLFPLQRAEFLWKGSHEGSLFQMFPLSLQSIISNQMRAHSLRGAWFSRFLRHPARRWSGSILSPGTHTGNVCVVTNIHVLWKRNLVCVLV